LSNAINLPITVSFRHHRATSLLSRRSFSEGGKAGGDGKPREFLNADGESDPEHFSVKGSPAKTPAKPADSREIRLSAGVVLPRRPACPHSAQWLGKLMQKIHRLTDN
jgi:hypothetical protein